jgi:hypothetical protein
MSRGFVWLLYEPAHSPGPWGSRYPREVWLECLRRSILTFAKFNPRECLLLIDAHRTLTVYEKQKLGCDWLTTEFTEDWPKSNWSKVLAHQVSPFRETCLVDLDVHFCAPYGDIFDHVTEPLGALHYPDFQRCQTRINTGISVCKDKRALAGWVRHRDSTRDRDDDELPLDRAIVAGDARVTLLPDTWARYHNAWRWWQSDRNWPVDQATSGARAYHWMELKPQMAGDVSISTMLG